ncbi:ABC-F family ATP-binding cassette domain-containing protein [Niabella drilacis]|uniref:ATP-binding cassette, subfamily F, uup n=1 Tax=Niabella drilacis (strain DSM 25811 / CCM 8410 / CCUG 62505 / LMG 26954 / E90) TaxID=1285928 RepID=A0A1G6V8N4_NIADE|nr:ABC-F family ATP-binding cassette domain-containing protein [Niabella drilacis]SDD49377.1 ATP-binding cassette, subfamily F, uup [Niabella drilacis]
MHYVSAEGLAKSYGIQPLFSDISFHIEEGDKVAIVARNGTGKSTLLKILAGKETPDSGKLWIHKDVEVILFEQDPDLEEELTVSDNIFFHNHPTVQAIREYEMASESGNADRIGRALIRMDELNAWDFDSRVKQIFGKLNIHHLDQKIKTLSGGQKKRVALARTLIDIGFEHKHVLLIMDEPTNHLDVAMVEWLEHFLGKENVTLLLVTHDRYFLDAVCNEIWEIEGSELYVHKGDYEYYLDKKAQRIENLSASIGKAKNLYRRELEWMRKQPKARTTKSKSREDNFYNIEKTAKQQVTDDQVQLQMKMNRLGGKIVEMKKIYKSFGDKKILEGFDYTFKKGERVGIIGKNGAGKSTFINILQGADMPDSGKINIGDTIVFGNYSQQGLILKEDMRVIEFVKNIAENFPLADGSTLSASQFLQLFLFDPDKQYTYVSKLSGGEKRRLHLLSILFRNPNFLILDEPTNDLDLPTLSVLENFLSEYPGCLLIVSHDRYFMDRLVDHLFVFEGDGIIRDFPGNYTQYRLQEKSQPAASVPAAAKAAPAQKPVAKKISFKEKREYELLEKEIADLNTEKETITTQLSGGTADFEQLEKLSSRIGEITALLDEKELRWLELSELIEG